MFKLANSPSAAGASSSPFESATLPASKSSPAKRRLSPVFNRPAAISISGPSILHNSAGITVSKPAGMIAPVMIFTHWPLATASVYALPANAVPTTAKRVALPDFKSLPANANPSIAELSCAGTLIGEITSAANTRSSACAKGSISVCITGCTNCAKNSFTLLAGKAVGS